MDACCSPCSGCCLPRSLCLVHAAREKVPVAESEWGESRFWGAAGCPHRHPCSHQAFPPEPQLQLRPTDGRRKTQTGGAGLPPEVWASVHVPETEREWLSPQRHWSTTPSWPTSLPVRGLCRLFSLWGFLLPSRVTWRLFSPFQKSEVLCWGSGFPVSTVPHGDAFLMYLWKDVSSTYVCPAILMVPAPQYLSNIKNLKYN